MNNLATTAKFFVMILGELTLLFIGISFLVALIQQFVPDEKMREVLGKPKRGLGNILGAAFGALTPFAPAQQFPFLLAYSAVEHPLEQVCLFYWLPLF